MKERFRDFFDPSRSIPLFIIGTAALALGLQALYDFANNPSQFQGGYWIAIAFLVIAIAIITHSWRKSHWIGWVGIREELKPNPRKGLIVLVGPTEASAPASIDYHLPALQFCWLIATVESLKTATKLYDDYREKAPQIYWGAPNYVVDPDQIQSTYDMVVKILEVEAVNAGIKSSDLIADMTGGTKPMTTGMGLACLARNLDMEYMKAPRDSAGQIIRGAKAEPIRIDTTFIPAAKPFGE